MRQSTQNQVTSRETEKKKLEKSDTYRQKLPFCLLNSGGKFKLYRVYNSDVSTDHAVTLAYELGSADIVRDDALCLRNMIAEAFLQVKNLPWLPTDDFIRPSDVY